MSRFLTLIRCPECDTPPNPAETWPCSGPGCEQDWEVFDTMGTCPDCTTVLADLSCPRCKNTTPLADWYLTGWEEHVQVRHVPTADALFLNFDQETFLAWETRMVKWLQERVKIPLKMVVDFPQQAPSPRLSCFTDADHQTELGALLPELKALVAEGGAMPQLIDHQMMLDVNLRQAGALVGYRSLRQVAEEAFQELTLPEQLQRLKTWAYEDALPMLGAFAAQMDRKYKGIRGMGRRLPAVDPRYPHEAARKTSGDPYYWRAFVEELEADDPILIMMKVLLHAGHGQFERAGLFASLYRVFANQRTFAHFYYEEFLWRFHLLQDSLQAEFERIQECLEERDWLTAERACVQINEVYPTCSEVHHFLFLIKQGQGTLSEARLEIRRDKIITKIYESNPWFDAWEYHKTKYDAYHHSLRKEGNALITLIGAAPDPDGTITFLIRLGIIATEIKDWGFAAHIFALLTKYRGLIEATASLHVMSWLMYSLKKLRIRDLTSRYKGDLLHEQRQIDRLLENRKKAHPAYQ